MEPRPARPLLFRLAAVGGALAVMALLGAMAAAIASARSEAAATQSDRFTLRAETSAGFVSTFLGEIAARAADAAAADLAHGRSRSRPAPGATGLALLRQVFGFTSLEVLDGSRASSASGATRTLPSEERAVLLGEVSGRRSGAFAVSGRIATSGGAAVVALAAPLPLPHRSWTIVATLPLSGTPLASFVGRVVAAPRHEVLLVDSAGRLLASAPPVAATGLAGWSPSLGAAAAGGVDGTIRGDLAGQPAAELAYARAPVPGAGWSLVAVEPLATLDASSRGWAGDVSWLLFVVAALLATALLGLFVRSLAERLRLEAAWGRMEHEARTDALTGLPNRRRLELALRHLQRAGLPFSVMMIDLDGFKEVNDSHGHAAGDELLRRMAAAMRASFREQDLYGRWGGDEFLAILPGAGPLEVAALAERLQLSADRLNLEGSPEGGPVDDRSRLPDLQLTVGSAASGSDRDVLLEADRALYESKARRPRLTTGVSP